MMAASVSVETASLASEAERSLAQKPGLLWRLFEPIAVDFLVYFRMAFGTIMLWEMVRYVEAGWVEQNYIDPPLHFTFYGFSWVRPWPGDGMYWHFYVMAALAALITVGLCYRIAAALFFVGFTYLFLIDQAYYLNHFYLVCLISFVMIFLPAHQAFSLDAWIRRRMRMSRVSSPTHAKPQAKSQAERDASVDAACDSSVVPAWTLWILRTLVGIVYFYGALAKLNMDWLTGNPMREMLAQADTFPLLGRLFHLEPVILFYAWGGLLLDLLIVPALCWKRTRLFALLAVAFFHLSNDQMFQIGIFPWFMLSATLLLWPPRKLEPLWLSRTVLGTVYVYACVAMMNTPWGPWGEEAAVRAVAMAASIACLPLMFWKPARLPAFLAAAAWLLIAPRTEYFGFGGLPPTLVSILPGLVVWGAIAVFPPDFLRSFRIVGESSGRRATPVPVTPSAPAHELSLKQKLTVGLLGLFVAVQCLVPLRHWLYPGNVHWTEEGHLFAWHMKLRYKNGRAAFRGFSSEGKPIPVLLADGYLIAEQDAGGGLTHILDADDNRLFALTPRDGRFVAVDADGIPVYELNANGWLTYELNDEGEPIYALDLNGERIYPRDGEGEPVFVRDERGEPIPPREPPYYLTPRQRMKMAERPEMLLQYSHFLADALRRQGYENVDIRADAFCSLNGREEQRLIDPEVNLAAVKSTLGHADWILPLDPNLKPGVLYRRELTQSNDGE